MREAAAGWLARRHGVSVDPAAVLPVIGTKEFIAWLPTLLGCGPGDVVAHPALAYPTYDVGRPAGRAPGRSPADSLPRSDPNGCALAWLNSPSNPTGQVLPAEHLRKVVSWARDRGTVVASDECYLELGWDATPLSVLHPDVCGESHRGLLAVHSLSKRSNLAGYRAGFVTGDPDLVAELLEVRKHAGMIVPAPVQAAMAAALNDDDHAARAVRPVTRPGGTGCGRRWRRLAGLSITPSPGCTCGPRIPAWTAGRSVQRLAGAGILVAPGDILRTGRRRHIRVALTATDERIDAAVQRLADLG